jgi:sporulation protein YlmC with PRC-barrel domain
MKTGNQIILYGVAAAIGLAVSTGARADDQDKTSTRTTSSFQKNSTIREKTLGDLEKANKLIGKTVFSSDNQKLGKIEDIIVDLESGRALYSIVGSGGILGAGEKKFAVAPGAFTETQGSDAHLNIDKAKFQASPEFTKEMDKETEFGRADFVNNVFQHYGQQPWWQGKTSGTEGSFHNVHKASDVVGMKVKNVSNEDIAKVDNVIIDLPAGRVVYAILAPDRSLDLGDNLYAFPPNALTLGSDRKSLVSDMTKERLSNAPHFAKNSWPNLADPAWASQVYQYHGKQAYFDSGIQPTSERDKERIYPSKK